MAANEFLIGEIFEVHRHAVLTIAFRSVWAQGFTLAPMGTLAL